MKHLGLIILLLGLGVWAAIIALGFYAWRRGLNRPY